MTGLRFDAVLCKLMIRLGFFLFKMLRIFLWCITVLVSPNYNYIANAVFPGLLIEE